MTVLAESNWEPEIGTKMGNLARRDRGHVAETGDGMDAQGEAPAERRGRHSDEIELRAETDGLWQIAGPFRDGDSIRTAALIRQRIHHG
ncbi:unnamed protein product [Lampetra planeri]